MAAAPANGRRRGRISYGTLGINQLGAVYEALLSFRGFFAEEDLYEVRPDPKGKKAEATDARRRRGRRTAVICDADDDAPSRRATKRKTPS